MRECWPAFSRGFHCRAGACRHTCCAGWDIDVDEESAYRFMTYKGEIGAIMKRYLAENDSGYQILLNEERRCPFLQRDGLCMLIREKGKFFGTDGNRRILLSAERLSRVSCGG